MYTFTITHLRTNTRTRAHTYIQTQGSPTYTHILTRTHILTHVLTHAHTQASANKQAHKQITNLNGEEYVTSWTVWWAVIVSPAGTAIFVLTFHVCSFSDVSVLALVTLSFWPKADVSSRTCRAETGRPSSVRQA